MRNKDITIPNIQGYFLGNKRYLLYELNIITEVYKQEQIVYRLAIKANKECLAQGFCKGCECPFPEKAFENRGCKNNCYGELLSEKDWQLYKLENDITIDKEFKISKTNSKLKRCILNLLRKTILIWVK